MNEANRSTEVGPSDHSDSQIDRDEERALVENFAKRVVEVCGDECVAVVFLPWSQGQTPDGVVAPHANGLLDMDELRGYMRRRSVVVAGCTFKFNDEEIAAQRIVNQLSNLEDVCVLAGHLLTPDVRLDRQSIERIGHVVQRILQTRVDDVLLDPDLDATALKLKIKMAKHSWLRNHQHFRSFANEDPQVPSAAELRHLEAVHHKLLWEDIPRELMPGFRAMDPALRETDNAIGDYELVAKMDSITGVVWQAQKNGVKYAVKCRDKKHIFTPGEVEGINRELRFMLGYVRHPNIVRATDFLHSPKSIYIVLEFAGKKNLVQYLSDLPHHRMEPKECLVVFRQIASALAHCHEKEITHRSVSLEHIVLSDVEDTGHAICAMLVDFHTATTAKAGTTFRSICGKLPCIAPEVLLGDVVSYIPMPADCWSLGVVLLEMAGGMGSLVEAVGLTEEEQEHVFDCEHHRYNGANKIRAYIITGGNHENALAKLSGVRHDEVLEILKVVLCEPDHRPELRMFGHGLDLEVSSVSSTMQSLSAEKPDE